MPVSITDVDIDEEHIETLHESDHDPEETVHRALTLYRELDNPDEMLRECDLLEGHQ